MKSEFRWTLVYRNAEGNTVHELYRTKAAAVKEAKRVGGKVYAYGQEPRV